MKIITKRLCGQECSDIYILGEYITSSSALCLAGRRVAMEIRRTARTGLLLVPTCPSCCATSLHTSSYKLPATLHGSFRKLPELRKTEYLLQASGKASGNLPEPSGTAAKRQNRKTSFRQASGNLPGPSGTATENKMVSVF